MGSSLDGLVRALEVKYRELAGRAWALTGVKATYRDVADELKRALAEAALAQGSASQFATSAPVPAEECYIAWCRYKNNSIYLCDSDAPGAFKVYRWNAVIANSKDCTRCGSPRESTIHDTQSKNTEIRMGAHEFVREASPDLAAAAQGSAVAREPATPDGWISIKRSFYDELLAAARGDGSVAAMSQLIAELQVAIDMDSDWEGRESAVRDILRRALAAAKETSDGK